MSGVFTIRLCYTVFMNPETFIFIGRSGCGKGTQAALLRAHLEKRDPARKVFYLESGARFREFIKGTTYTHSLSREIYEKAARQPDFLAVHLWGHIFIEEMKGGEHIIIDGTPRSLYEAQMLDTAMDFYKREKPFVIFVDVSKEWSRARLAGRGREDDIAGDEVERRLAWFDKDVMPAVSFYGGREDYTLITVNGEQTVEQVHDEIMLKLGIA